MPYHGMEGEMLWSQMASKWPWKGEGYMCVLPKLRLETRKRPLGESFVFDPKDFDIFV